MTQWIPESQRDTRWWIWHKQFLCRVSNIQSMSVEYIKQFGMPSSGDVFYDKQTANELVMRMLTINDMVEFFRNGVAVYVCKYADTKEIYERISDHLSAWKNNLQYGIHTRNAPIDDLILLDRFANVVYQHAKYQFTPDIVDSLLARRISSVMSRPNSILFRSGPQVTSINPETGQPETEEPTHPDRVSMADVFAGRKTAPSAPKPALPQGGMKWK